MDWIKLKEKFPKGYQEIREHSLKTNTTGKECLYTFLDSKGYPDILLRINQLKEYENSNRNFIGIEKDENYFKIANERINGTKSEPNQFEKPEQRGLFLLRVNPQKLIK